MPSLTLRANHKAVLAYYESLAAFKSLGTEHESAVRSAFATLLEAAAKPFGWKLVPEHSMRVKGKRIAPDGTLMDLFSLHHGHWEAKDSRDDLDKEIRAKLAKGYPTANLLFWEPRRAVLYQHGDRIADVLLEEPTVLLAVLKQFLEFAPDVVVQWEAAVIEFKDKVPELGKALAAILRKARQENPQYAAAFAGFVTTCRTSLNPNLSEAAVEEMLVQHLLTERLLRKIFDIEDFRRRNVIAADIEQVIDTLSEKHFKRSDFLKALDPFYLAIETAAETFTDFTGKQKFLNIVYERFFQGFAVKQADVLGVVYTPQPLVQFMIASVEHVLREHFDTSLGSKGVHIFDPFTGTGNFIVNIMQPEHIPSSALQHKYAHELHCNEVSLLPYYVASMNIEHAYYERMKSYEPFEGICLVDTFETVEKEQAEFDIFNEANSERVKRQRAVKDIRVVIANPPYNAWQQDENDNNKNRRYPEMDRRVKQTYSDDSRATLRNSLGDPYVTAFRFASDRVGDQGVVCYVSNNGFVDGIAADGMRKHLAQDFDLIYVLDLGGNVRKNPKLSGTTHNVFGIQVGVCVTLLIRLGKRDAKRKAAIYYHAVPVDWRRETKDAYLNEVVSIAGVDWGKARTPDAHHRWLTNGIEAEFAKHFALGGKSEIDSQHTIFSTFCRGACTNNDSHVYDFNRGRLAQRAEEMVETYEMEMHRWQKRGGAGKRVEDVIKIDPTKLKWIRRTKRELERGTEVEFADSDLRRSLYRPFTKRWLFNNRVFCEDLYRLPTFFSTFPTEKENIAIVVTDSGSEKPFMVLVTKLIPDLHVVGGGASSQVFPLYTYADDGKHRQENVRSSALEEFRNHYTDDRITREQIFYYVYAMLHHPDYRARYAENLKRELPRIPLTGMAEDFHDFARVGRKLADLHVGYESVKPYKLQRIENSAEPPNWRVEAMKLGKDESTVIYNQWLTLAGVPPQALTYRLGNRSALAWVIDQYRVERNADGEIISDPNAPDDEEAIVRLVGQVVTVSVETMKLVKSLPELHLGVATSQDSTSTPQSEASAAHIHYIHEEPATYGDLE